MRNEKQKHRSVGETISDLLEHIDWKLSILPEAVKSWGLDDEVLNSLSANLKREREVLASLPQDITLKEAMDTYFKGQAGTAGLFDSLIPDDHPHKKK